MRRRTHRGLSMLAAAVALVGGPASATAEQSVAPPGNAGVEEYQESIPTAEGNAPTNDIREGADGAAAAVPPRVRGELRQLGPDGEAAAALADATAPSARPDGDRPGRRQGRALAEDPRYAAPSAGTSVTAAMGGSSGGMGLALPILLALTLIGGLAWLMARRRAG